MRNQFAPDASLRPPARSAGAVAVARRARRVLGAFGVTLALALGATGARADDDATIAMARERFKEGVQFFDQKQYDKARAAFLQAYALKRHPAVLLNLAQSELRSDHEADAAKHFSQYLREHKDASDAERQTAEAGLATAKAQVAEVTVTADEEGAVIAVDGTTEGQSPLAGSLFIKPGARTLTAKKDGREAALQVTLSAGQATSVTLRLRKPAKPAAAATTAPKARPTRDETPTEADLKPVERRPQPSTTTFEADADTTTDQGREPFFRWAAHSPVAWVGGGLTLLGAAGGVGFAIAAKQKYSDADTIVERIRTRAGSEMPPLETMGICRPRVDSPDPQERKEAERIQNVYGKACRLYTDTVDDGDDFKTAAWVSVGVGVVAAGSTVAYYLLSSPSPDESGKAPKLRIAHVTPILTRDSQGISVGGTF